MAEKVLGIDIGSNTLKVVQVNRNLRVVEVTGYASANLPPNAEPSQVASLLKDLLAEHELESDRHVLALGTQEAFLRRLRFPFTSERKIAQVIRFELEPSLPIGLDETHVDFVKTERLPDGSQMVTAAALPRRVIDPLLQAFGEVGIVPDVVNLDGSALTVIADELGEQIPEQVVILDIGHRKTNLIYRRQGRNYSLRALSFGCNRLAKGASSVLGLPLDEGLRRVLSVGLDGPTKTPEDEKVRALIEEEIQRLVREVEVSILALQPEEGRQSGPEMVVLCGGGSLMGGLAPALAEAFDLPVRCLADFKDVSALNHFRDRPAVLAQFALPAGLTLTDRPKAWGFNFLQEELRSRDPLVRWRRHLGYALVAGLVVGFGWLGTVGADIYSKKQRLRQLDEGIETVFHRVLPDFRGSVGSAQYTSILKGKINDLNQAVSLFGSEAKVNSAVELLRSVSQAIPANLDVTLTMLTMDKDQARISGKADAFNTVDVAKNRLAGSDNFGKVTITGAKAASDGKGVQFSLELLRHSDSGETQ
jgi:type IV pilus assembly protein PilM